MQVSQYNKTGSGISNGLYRPKKRVRTRFPPSPTGYLHIGGARTAIFNWLFARHHKGTFILRIEDTDITRSSKESLQGILESLKWLGIDWDEGPYFQSQRIKIYQKYADQLLDTGNAYWCHCTPEELEERRKLALARDQKPKYDGKCRDLNLGASQEAVVRFRTPLSGKTIVNDLIKGPVSFDNAELDDLIILRSDGYPTYNFAVVVDDITMDITHVIRGDDHLNNTPRQILIYEALEFSPPEFAHVPMILGHDRARLSKRHGATSVIAYKEMGYLPQAMTNYLVRLGWSYGDQEIFSLDEMVEKFSLDSVGKSSGVFNPEKLLWLNAHYIKEERPDRLAKELAPFLEDRGYPVADMEYVAKAAVTLQARSKTMAEMARSAEFYFKEDILFEEKAARKYLKPEMYKVFRTLISELNGLVPFDRDAAERVFRDIQGKIGLSMTAFAQSVRIALTGGTISPGLFEVMEVLGKERVVHRLEKAIEYMSGSSGGWSSGKTADSGSVDRGSNPRPPAKQNQ